MRNHVLDGIMGLCVADALGVPVEFMDRKVLIENPVVNMRGLGTYNQPAGTWSDDTSMSLCLLDSLSRELNYNDIMLNFLKWYINGEYTAHGEVFDIGITTKEALVRFQEGISPLECGGKSEYDNGNGSLMRILPTLFYIQAIYGSDFQEIDEAFQIIHNISALTHAHKRSQIACGIYISVASMLLGEMNLEIAIDLGIYKAMEYYRKQDDFTEELEHFSRLENKDFKKTPIEEIRSGGYTVSTLEAAIWCLLNTNDYKSCALQAVNLGNDTDTVAAVAGGLAGIKYGCENIPQEWLEVIAKKEYIENLCSQFNLDLTRKAIRKLSAFIPYFETATGESVCHWGGGEKLGEKHYTMSYPVYDRTLDEFIQKFYKTNLICYDYLNIIDSKGLEMTSKINNAIDDADIQLLKAIFTGYVRQERFCDGLWADAVEDKVFLKILNRFNELLFA